MTKIDYHINNKHSINGMLFIGNYTGDGMDHPWLNKIFNDTNPDPRVHGRRRLGLGRQFPLGERCAVWLRL